MTPDEEVELVARAFYDDWRILMQEEGWPEPHTWKRAAESLKQANRQRAKEWLIANAVALRVYRDYLREEMVRGYVVSEYVRGEYRAITISTQPPPFDDQDTIPVVVLHAAPDEKDQRDLWLSKSALASGGTS